MSELSQAKRVRETALGIRVTKTAAVTAVATDLFTVTGECLITLMYGIVTGVGDGTVVTLALNEKASSIIIAAATTVTSDLVGEVYLVVGDGTEILNGAANVPHLKTAYGLAASNHSHFIMDGQAGLIIELTASDATDATLAVKWVILYIPLEEGSSIVAA
jgi:hypothetical protein